MAYMDPMGNIKYINHSHIAILNNAMFIHHFHHINHSLRHPSCNARRWTAAPGLARCSRPSPRGSSVVCATQGTCSSGCAPV